jgi:hypothetical protein
VKPGFGSLYCRLLSSAVTVRVALLIVRLAVAVVSNV